MFLTAMNKKDFAHSCVIMTYLCQNNIMNGKDIPKDLME